MTIDQFIRKWAPSDIRAVQDFQDDPFSTFEGGDYQKVAIQILTHPQNHSLRIYNDHSHVIIAYGHKDNPDYYEWIFSKAVGIVDQDWLMVLQGLSNHAINSQK